MTKRIQNSLKLVLVGVLSICLFMSVACGKKSETEKALSLAKSLKETVTPSSAQNDYTKPYLTEEKIAKFIESLKEEINPFDVVFKKGGQVESLADLKDKLEEYNAFARKYGFADYADYMAVWGRVTVAEIVMAGEEMKKSTIEMMESSVKSAEEALKNPDLNEDMRKMYEEQIESNKKSLEDLKKPETSQLNEADLALVKKFKSEIDAATEKYKKNPR